MDMFTKFQEDIFNSRTSAAPLYRINTSNDSHIMLKFESPGYDRSATNDVRVKKKTHTHTHTLNSH